MPSGLQIVRKKSSVDRRLPTILNRLATAFAQVRRRFPEKVNDDRQHSIHGGVVPLQRVKAHVEGG
jgi:hypothetical protein